jgi:hypothetical protein
LVLGATACQDQLDVPNPNAPDGARALARPSDVEALIGSSYQAVHANSIGGSNDAIQPQALVMSMESFSNLANFGMSLRSSIPRSGIDNTRNNAAFSGNYRDFLGLHRAARQAATGLSRVSDPNFTFFPASATQKSRARAFGHFVLGAALGNVALIYEQGSAVSSADVTSSTPLPFVPYDSLMRYALAELDSAIAIAATAGTQIIPAGWLGSSTGATYTLAQFTGLARAYKARFRAGVARTPTERAAVDWASVIADAAAGVAQFPADYAPQMTPSVGWDVSWVIQHYASSSTNWHMMWQYFMGMADTSGGYNAWLATPNASKLSFLVVTPDLRFPAGTTRAAQSATGGNSGTFALTGNQYFRNRSAAPDWAGDVLANSQYDHFRFRAYFNASRIGTYPVFTTAEMNMLAAEGQIRLGNFDAAATLINITRVGRGGLPLLPAGMTLATPVPGGTACVPRVPSIASPTAAACGNILEAMKWEKRLETEFTGPYMWYTDGRGWGDLPEGTALWWPVPYQEIDTRQLSLSPPPYTNSVGGIGSPGGAAKGSYGI